MYNIISCSCEKTQFCRTKCAPVVVWNWSHEPSQIHFLQPHIVHHGHSLLFWSCGKLRLSHCGTWTLPGTAMATAPSNQQPQRIRELCRGHLSFLDAHQEKRNEAYSTPSFHDNALTKCGQKKIRFKVGRGKKKWKKQTGYIHTYVYIYICTYIYIYINLWKGPLCLISGCWLPVLSFHTTAPVVYFLLLSVS